MPALLTAIRKIADVEEGMTSLVFDGILYPNDKVIIYDLSNGKPVKKRGRRKKENNEEAVEDTVTTAGN